MTSSDILEYHKHHTKAKIVIANALAASASGHRVAAFWGTYNVQYIIESRTDGLCISPRNPFSSALAGIRTATQRPPYFFIPGVETRLKAWSRFASGCEELRGLRWPWHCTHVVSLVLRMPPPPGEAVLYVARISKLATFRTPMNPSFRESPGPVSKRWILLCWLAWRNRKDRSSD